MIAFLDTSALIKLYIAEAGSQTLQGRIEGAAPAVSQLTYGEMYATFARRQRENLLTAEEHQTLCDSLENDWSTLLRVPLSDEVLKFVPGLCKRHSLRGADALQLASAVMLEAAGCEILFITSDPRLLAAGVSEGIEVFNPQSSR